MLDSGGGDSSGVIVALKQPSSCVFRRVQMRVFEAQRGASVAAAIGHRCPSLHPALGLKHCPPIAHPVFHSLSHIFTPPCTLHLHHPWTVPVFPVIVLSMLVCAIAPVVKRPLSSALWLQMAPDIKYSTASMAVGVCRSTKHRRLAPMSLWEMLGRV